MNRITTILLLTASLALATEAATAATWQVGLKGGVAIQTLGGDDVPSDLVGNRTGFAGGAYFQAGFSKNFGVRVETLYFMKGASADSADVKVSLKLDYVEFPVLAVVTVPVSETARLDLFGGPTFSFNTKALAEASLGSLSGTLDIGNAVKDSDIGLTFGAGMSFNVGRAILGFDGRYGMSLDTIADSGFVGGSGVTNVNGNSDIKNEGFAIMASIGMPVGTK
jgi:hypothetical protein